ncbi:MAG: glutathione synthase [Alphaproteobacteria bacterium]
MTLHVALQMDDLGRINPATDSTIRIGLEAQARGHTLWYYTPDKLFTRDGTVMAHASRLTLQDGTENFYSIEEPAARDIRDWDVIWLRQDPPFDLAYITSTLMLSRAHTSGDVFVVNHPCSVRNLPEKWFPTELAQFMPPTLISADMHSISDFIAQYGHVVVKPLYGHAGHGIFQLAADAPDKTARLAALFAKDRTPVVVQKFLPEMKDGERRVIMIDGKFAAIAGRIPAEGQIVAASRLGAQYVAAKATPRQMEICEAVGPLLKERGLIYTGLDIISDWLTEINITSPTSIPPINKLYGLKLEADIWDAVESYLP